MKVFSRRGFFQSLGGGMEQGSIETPLVQEIVIGQIADYAPGERRCFRDGLVTVEVTAAEDGIRARRHQGTGWAPIAIRMDHDGRLLAQIMVGCGDQELFSILCGRMKLP